ncbi:mitochondrial carrier [Microstroma glucosiphilum]|uniref:Mitochondrial carrier n=1 Tax=Pseudomicrostroma glucosiphilum TaxID=1684307 RepID=A0A316UDH3_9BASI|nr:mitochondrial carrier [Pseudomicrostroma glucosiphilum]PWN23256.1 mitochondrial carrier [Pseudomicrostroma glucosiphilum]
MTWSAAYYPSGAECSVSTSHYGISSTLAPASSSSSNCSSYSTREAIRPPIVTLKPLARSWKVHAPNEEVFLESSGVAKTDQKKLSRATKDILFGSIAGMVAKVFEHPFDLIKVRLQTQPFSDPGPGQGKPKGTLYNGAFDAFRLTVQKEGLIGLFRGLSMPIVGATLENATLFFTYNALQGQIRRFNGEASAKAQLRDSPEKEAAASTKANPEAPLSLPQLAIAAAGAGAVTSFVLTPIELIKCRMQVQMISAEAAILAREATGKTSGPPMVEALNSARRALPGPVALVREAVRKDGFGGLWLGQTGTLLRETGGGMAWFLAFESTSRWFLRRRERLKEGGSGGGEQVVTSSELKSWQLVVAGALAGVSYNVVLFPADSVKSTIQTEAELSPAGTKPSSFMATLRRIYTTRGLAGLYAGCGITCLRSGPSSALIFLLYNRLEGFVESKGW